MPSEIRYEPRSPKYSPFLVLGPFDTNYTHMGPTYLGVGGQQRALCDEEVNAHVQCTNLFPSFCHFEWILRPFWAKKANLGHKKSNFGWAPTDSAPQPRGTTGEFLAP